MRRAELRERQAVRGLFVDPTGALLLLQTRSRRGPIFWLTPGGGIEGDESPHDALARELREEVGYTLTGPVPEVHQRAFEYLSQHGPTRQSERYFLIRTPRFTPRFDFVPTEDERSALIAFDWWTAAAMRAATAHTFAPRNLPEIVEGLV